MNPILLLIFGGLLSSLCSWNLLKEEMLTGAAGFVSSGLELLGPDAGPGVLELIEWRGRPFVQSSCHVFLLRSYS